MSDERWDPTQNLSHPTTSNERNGEARIPGYLAGWSRYEAVGRLGSGGMGEVFKAWDPQLGRYVALKFLSSSDPETLERFQREARAQARVDHPAICKVFEVGEVAGRHYIAMQEIQGVTLDRIARSLTLEQKARLVREIADAMHAAHRLGLIHRDLKPGNILVEEAEDGSLRPFIVDFGLARDQQSPPGGATISGMIAGTVGYMSPEQARGRFGEIDRRTDVYNLGVILYELVTGRLPHEFENILESLLRLQTEEAPSPRRFNRSLPADLETVIMKALERDPARRYESAHALAIDLQHFLDGEPIVARRANLLYRLRMRLRKHRVVASVSAVALLLLLSAGGYVIKERWRADARAELAQRFGMQIKEIELLTRVARMLPSDRAISIRSIVVPRMDRIRRQMGERGSIARGPGSYALARGSLALGDYRSAWTLLEEAREAGYDTPDVHYARGLVLGHFYEEALTRAAGIDEQELRKASRRAAERRYRVPAIDELRRAAGVSIETPELLRAQLALYEEHFDEAIAAARRAAAAAPWLYEATLIEVSALRSVALRQAELGQFEEALAGYAVAAERLKSVTGIARADAAVHYDECRLQSQILQVLRFQDRLNAEIVAQATVPCVEATRLDPRMAGPWTSRGVIHTVFAEEEARHGRDPGAHVSQARGALNRAIALDPDEPAALAGLGRAELTQARWGVQRGIDPRPRLDAAQQALERAVAADPGATSPRMTLANLMLTRAEYERRIGGDSKPFLIRAIAHARRALETDRDVFLLHNSLGNIYNMLADREMEKGEDPRGAIGEAARALDRAVALNPSSAPLHNNRGNTWLALTEHLAGRGEPIDDSAARAVSSYREAIRVRPDYALAWFNLGYTHRLVALDRVRRGADPTDRLRDSSAALDRYDAANAGDIDALTERARCAIIEARWLLARGHDPRPALAKADRDSRRARAVDSGAVTPMLIAAERARWEAEWLSRRNERTSEAIRAGLGAIARVREAEPANPDARSLEASLLMIDARSRQPGAAAEMRKRATALIQEALRAKPSLRPDYAGLR